MSPEILVDGCIKVTHTVPKKIEIRPGTKSDNP